MQNGKDMVSIPKSFRYSRTYQKGKPVHDRFDAFSMRHPAMPLEKRAKIFAPFDALKGFDEAIAAKDIRYEERTELSEEDMHQLNIKLDILHRLTINGTKAALIRCYKTNDTGAFIFSTMSASRADSLGSSATNYITRCRRLSE